MPHDATERVCPNTGLKLEPRAKPRDARPVIGRSMMSELPPPEPHESYVYNPASGGGRAVPPARPSRPEAAPAARPVPAAAPPKKELHRELLGQTIGGRYRIRGVLGEGGMGTVYDAEHVGLSRQVAIKVLSPAQSKKRVAVKRFQQEARAAGAIGHPNICEVYDLGLLDDGSPYLVMEKLVGETLSDRIAKEGGLPFDEVVAVVAQVLSGLIAAHEKGIVHRDIKPENIFLARRAGAPPIIKLLDFGVSKMLPEFQNGEDFDLTRTGMVMGTPYYMSPEQARGERNLDGRVDVYACGVVMYESITGKRPFIAANYNALLLAIINTLPRSLREIRPSTPVELESIVMRAMAKNRDDRYPSAKHLLRDVASPLPGAIPPPPAPPQPAERPRAARPEPPPPPRNAGPADSASTVLRSRMADVGKASPLKGGVVDPMVFDDTVAGSRPQDAAPSATAVGRLVESDSIDIPIEVEAPIEEGGDERVLKDSQPTDVFRQSEIPVPADRPSQQRSDTDRGHAPHAKAGRAREAMRGREREGTTSTRADLPRHRATPVDWDGATLVKREPREVADVAPAQSNRRRPPTAPFNPDDTMKIDSQSDIELIDDDGTGAAAGPTLQSERPPTDRRGPRRR
jgi:serine/threonine-protein kinase